ncbi:hypothetical protein PF002_g32884, partial [Phytophthora fragariae]
MFHSSSKIAALCLAAVALSSGAHAEQEAAQTFGLPAAGLNGGVGLYGAGGVGLYGTGVATGYGGASAGLYGLGVGNAYGGAGVGGAAGAGAGASAGATAGVGAGGNA